MLTLLKRIIAIPFGLAGLALLLMVPVAAIDSTGFAVACFLFSALLLFLSVRLFRRSPAPKTPSTRPRQNRSNNWEDYRWKQYELAKKLQAKNDYRSVLPLLCSIAYIDLNGPQDPQSVKLLGHKPFMAEHGITTPDIIGRLVDTIESLGITLSQLETVYRTQAQQLRKSAAFPLTPKKGWQALHRELKACYKRSNMPMP